MQVKVQTEENIFKPIKLELLIESAEELEVIQKMAKLTITVPQSVYESTDKRYTTLQNVLKEIYYKVNTL